MEFVNKSKSEELQRPFRITFPPFKQEEQQPQAKVGCCTCLLACLPRTCVPWACCAATVESSPTVLGSLGSDHKGVRAKHAQVHTCF